MKNDHKSRRKDLFANADELTAFAQAYYATEFPSTGDSPCLASEELKNIAATSTPPSDELLEHLFNCSDCFRTFRAARRASHEAVIDAGDDVHAGNFGTPENVSLSRLASPHLSSSRNGAYTFTFNVRRTHVAMFAACLALIVSSLAAFFAVYRAVLPSEIARTETVSPPSAPSAISIATPNINAPMFSASPEDISTDTPTNRHSTQTFNAQNARRRNPPTAKATPPNSSSELSARPTTTKPRDAQRLPIVTINLEQIALLRQAIDNEAAKPDTQPVITLAPRSQRLRLRLPEGSRAGRYAVSIVDAFGKNLISAHAASNGKTLQVKLDLTSLAPKNYRLLIAREGEAPDYYAVTIRSKTPDK